jgi:hypothetical protein
VEFFVRSVPRLYDEDHRENPNIRGIGQGKARHKKYKRLKLGGGQAHDCSAD